MGGDEVSGYWGKILGTGVLRSLVSRNMSRVDCSQQLKPHVATCSLTANVEWGTEPEGKSEKKS